MDCELGDQEGYSRVVVNGGINSFPPPIHHQTKKPKSRWEYPPPPVLDLIFHKLDSVSGCYSFMLVCKTWFKVALHLWDVKRRSNPNPNPNPNGQTTQQPLFPTHVPMLAIQPHHPPWSYDYYSLITQKLIHDSSHNNNLQNVRIIGCSTPEGLMILYHTRTMDFEFYDPRPNTSKRRPRLDLPDQVYYDAYSRELYQPIKAVFSSSEEERFVFGVLYGRDNNSATWLLLIQYLGSDVYVADHFSHIDDGSPIVDVACINYNGTTKIAWLNRQCEVCVASLEPGDPYNIDRHLFVPSNNSTIVVENYCPPSSKFYIVERANNNGILSGNIWLVIHDIYYDEKIPKSKFRVFEGEFFVDAEEEEEEEGLLKKRKMEWREVKSLDDEVMFLSPNSAFCISAPPAEFHLLRNCIYFLGAGASQGVLVYDVRHGSLPPELVAASYPHSMGWVNVKADQGPFDVFALSNSTRGAVV